MKYSDMLKFCNIDPEYDGPLRKPILYRARLYACDGKICIRCLGIKIPNKSVSNTVPSDFKKKLSSFFSNPPNHYTKSVVYRKVSLFNPFPHKKGDDVRLDLGGVYMSQNLLKRIIYFPGLEIALNPVLSRHPQRFRFDGGDGIFAPLMWRDYDSGYKKVNIFGD